MHFNVPWISTPSGVALSEGSTVTISADGARDILFGVYVGGYPVIIGQAQDGQNSISFVLKRSDRSLKGPAVLKITAYGQSWNPNGFQSNFQII